jgi:hypothetical protein
MTEAHANGHERGNHSALVAVPPAGNPLRAFSREIFMERLTVASLLTIIVGLVALAGCGGRRRQ